jgi:hypothetical protein
MFLWRCSRVHSALVVHDSRHHPLPEIPPTTMFRRPGRCSLSVAVVGFYVTVRLVYSFALTFSSVLPAIITWSRPEIGHLAAAIDVGSGPCGALARHAMAALAAFEESSTVDEYQLSQRSREVAKSCDLHLGRLVDDVNAVISGSALQRRLSLHAFRGKF